MNAKDSYDESGQFISHTFSGFERNTDLTITSIIIGGREHFVLGWSRFEKNEIKHEIIEISRKDAEDYSLFKRWGEVESIVGDRWIF